MRSFLQYILEDKKEMPTIAFVAGAFRPPTAGHLHLVKSYSDMPNVNKVVIIISNPQDKKSVRATKFGLGISPEDSKRIFEKYINVYGIKNAEIVVSKEPSPIKCIKHYIDDNVSNSNIIIGTSKKGDDVEKRKYIQDYFDNQNMRNGINILNVNETAIEPLKDETGAIISANGIRNHCDDDNYLKKALPSKLSNDDREWVKDILLGSEMKPMTKENLELGEFNSCNACLDDDALMNSKMFVYCNDQQKKNVAGKIKPYNPKSFPKKAIDIKFEQDGNNIDVYFNTFDKCWDSEVKTQNGETVKLSPEQMSNFFKSNFYELMLRRIGTKWPLTDKFFKELFLGIRNREMKVGSELEPNVVDEKKTPGEMKKKGMSPSGRRFVKFSDTNVNVDDSEFYCWPPEGKEFSWSTWKNWHTQRPFAKIIFNHNGTNYGVTTSLYDENFEDRGWRAFDADFLEGNGIAWLSKDESNKIRDLSIFQKFTKQCVKRIKKYISMDNDEILKKINRPDKIDEVHLMKTKRIIKKVLENIKNMQFDNFKWRSNKRKSSIDHSDKKDEDKKDDQN